MIRLGLALIPIVLLSVYAAKDPYDLAHREPMFFTNDTCTELPSLNWTGTIKRGEKPCFKVHIGKHWLLSTFTANHNSNETEPVMKSYYARFHVCNLTSQLAHGFTNGSADWDVDFQRFYRRTTCSTKEMQSAAFMIWTEDDSITITITEREQPAEFNFFMLYLVMLCTGFLALFGVHRYKINRVSGTYVLPAYVNRLDPSLEEEEEDESENEWDD